MGSWKRSLSLQRPGGKGEAAISRDPDSESVLVEAVLNNETKAVLVVDTGAEMVVLSKQIGEKMGVDVSTDTGRGIIDLHLAGGKTVKARATTIGTIDVEGVVAKDVAAAVLLEDKGSVGFRDGLLGRSFLNRYNISIDLKKMKMVMEELK